MECLTRPKPPFDETADKRNTTGPSRKAAGCYISEAELEVVKCSVIQCVDKLILRDEFVFN